MNSIARLAAVNRRTTNGPGLQLRSSDQRRPPTVAAARLQHARVFVLIGLAPNATNRFASSLRD